VDTRSRARLSEAVVELAGFRRTIRVDSAGNFSFANVPDGEVLLRTRRIGYYPGKGTVLVQETDSASIEIGLDPVLYCLDCAAEPTPTPGYVRILR
jgi:Carboxypeptidase regulatory-like domain